MPRKPILPPASEPAESQTLYPSDHLRTLIGLLRPAGPDLARRWVAALMLAPEQDRAAIVEAIERRMTELYAPPGNGSPTLGIVHPPVQRDGFIEQVFAEYRLRPVVSNKPARRLQPSKLRGRAR